MSWSNGSYPAAYRNQPVRLRQKAVEIANNLMVNGVDEGSAIREALERAREFFLTQHARRKSVDTDLPAWP
ncbi:hypothetical protein [Puia sp.]|jgi:uncharacterized protein YdaT|uniref:hypothetical protein n=1 Tax=Puia sp. TaxID=2045100 RepID=UPI002F414617